MNVNLAIIDDQESILEEIRTYSEKISDVNLVLTTTDVSELLMFIEEVNSVDVVLLDINMPVSNGFDIAQYIRENFAHIKIIFMSAYQDFALQGYKYYPEDFLTKPINFLRLKYTLSRLGKRMEGKKKIGIKTNKKIILVDVDNILFVEKKGRKSLIHLQTGELVESSESLNKIEDILSCEDFFRAHQSYLVSINQIEYIELDNFMKSYNIKLKNYDPLISLSRHKYTALKDLIKQHF